MRFIVVSIFYICYKYRNIIAAHISTAKKVNNKERGLTMRMSVLIIFIAIALLQAACGSTPMPTPITIVETVEVEATRQVTQLVTQQVTREVVVTATPEPTSTATPEPRVIFEDDFEPGDSEWFLGEMPEGSSQISNGQLAIEVQEPAWVIWASHPELDLLDEYVLDMDISYVSGPTDATGGIAFRCNQEGEEWLVLGLDADGFFSVWRETWDDYTELLEFAEVIPWVQTNAIARGQAINHVRLIDESRGVTVYINEELVTSFPYASVRPGCPLLFVQTFEQEGATWVFDNVTVREIGP
jgi:hypothetical protein